MRLAGPTNNARRFRIKRRQRDYTPESARRFRTQGYAQFRSRERAPVSHHRGVAEASGRQRAWQSSASDPPENVKFASSNDGGPKLPRASRDAHHGSFGMPSRF